MYIFSLVENDQNESHGTINWSNRAYIYLFFLCVYISLQKKREKHKYFVYVTYPCDDVWMNKHVCAAKNMLKGLESRRKDCNKF